MLKMKQRLPWSPCLHEYHSLFIASRPFPILRSRRFNTISATAESTETLTAREKRQLRNKNRESNLSNWGEEVEDKLLQESKGGPLNKKLDLEELVDLGPQWWNLRVAGGKKTIDLLVNVLAEFRPDFKYEIFSSAVDVKRKLKNGTISVKTKLLYPGNIFIRCVLNKELHDFLCDCTGVHGFSGFEVGKNRSQKTIPKPVSILEIEALREQIKVEQEEADKAFEEEQQTIQSYNVSGVAHQDSNNVTVSIVDSKPKRKSRKKSSPLENNEKPPARGSTVQIVSGAFAEFSGSVKMLNRKTGKVTVGVTVFGKESLVDLDISEIVAEKN